MLQKIKQGFPAVNKNIIKYCPGDRSDDGGSKYL
jgi:hypothetical protein